MFKKLLALILTFLMAFSIGLSVYATPLDELISSETDLTVGSGAISSEDEFIVIQDWELNERIDQLFAMRCELEVDFENNQDAIDQIDCQLAQLGVETISYAEVLSKSGADALPCVEFSPRESEENSQWTSRRQVVNYAGTLYELQIIEGVPLNKNSKLRKTYTSISYEANGIIAGVTEVIKVIAPSGLANVSEFSAGVTILDMLASIGEAVYDSIQTSTVIDNVTGTANLTFSSHLKYIYVKGYGSSDSYQKLGYLGNYFYCAIALPTVLDGPIGEHGSLPEYDLDLSNSFEAYAAYFNDYTMAVKNYRHYQNNDLDSFQANYLIDFVELDILGTENLYYIPICVPTIYDNE